MVVGHGCFVAGCAASWLHVDESDDGTVVGAEVVVVVAPTLVWFPCTWVVFCATTVIVLVGTDDQKHKAASSKH